MMKTVFAVLLISLGVSYTKAQGIFNQNETEHRNLTEQIILLRTYAGYVKDGNKILKDGTGLISSIKDGDLNIHKGNFDSLKRVSSSIRNSSKVKSIMAMSSDLNNSGHRTLKLITNSKELTNAEISGIQTMCKNLAAEASKDIDELKLIITDGELQMTDDQRLKAIDRIYLLIQKKYTAQRAMSNTIIALIKGRKQGIKDVATMKSIYGN